MELDPLMGGFNSETYDDGDPDMTADEVQAALDRW
jgi:hypothetical protein